MNNNGEAGRVPFVASNAYGPSGMGELALRHLPCYLKILTLGTLSIKGLGRAK